MSNRSLTNQSRITSGKRALVILASLTAIMAVCFVVLMINGCKPKPEPSVPAPKTNAAPTVSATTPAQTEPSIMSNKKALSDIYNNMSKTESQEFARLLAQNPEYGNLSDDDPGEEPSAEDLPKFFPLTDALKELIRLAENALRMNLSDEEKLAALEELDGINHPDILEVVQAALLEANAEVREAALDAIMDINDPAVIPTVIKALDDEDPELREYALDALMDVDDPSLNEAFLKALDDENLDVREAAADMMLFIESPNIIDSLGKALQDPNEDIRDMALITIEDIPDKRSVDILIQQGLLNDNETIREDALDSIEWITDKEFDNYEDARKWWDANRETFEFDD